MGKFLLRSVFCLIMIVSVSYAAPLRPFSDAPQWTIDEMIKICKKIDLDFCPAQSFRGCSPITRYEMAVITAHILEKLPSCKPGKTSFECKYQIRLHRKNFTISNKELDGLMKSIKKLIVEFKDELTALGVEPFYKFPMIKKQSFSLNTSKFFLLNPKMGTHHSH